MKRLLWCIVACLIIALPVIGHASITIYHLHKESSETRGILKLSEAGPDTRATALRSAELKGKPAGEYLIKAFVTPTGVPGTSGVIPAGTAMVFSLWMKKTANFGTMYPMANINLNSDAGTSLCTAIGAQTLTTTLSQQTFTCYTNADVTMNAADRLYLRVGVNMTAGPGSNRVTAELDIEGALNGNYDSRVAFDRQSVTNISPTSGSVGTVVTITGKSFGATQGTGTVTFNGTPATVNSWSDTQITAIVPSGVSLSPGMVVVTFDGIQSNGLPFSVFLPTGYITTVAGNGGSTYSGNGGPAPYAGLYARDVSVDSHGNLYIASEIHHVVRKVDPNGVITTYAGTGVSGYSGDGGLAIYAQLNSPTGVALDSLGNLYIAESSHRIRKVATNGIITTVAGNGVAGYSGEGGLATNAQINSPVSVSVDSQGNLFIVDAGNHRIRKVDDSGIITTVAGNGIAGYSGDGGAAINAALGDITDVAVDGSGNMFIAMTTNLGIVRRVDMSGIISTVMNSSTIGGYYLQAMGITVDAFGNLLVSDAHNEMLWRIRPSDTVATSATRIAGTGLTCDYGDGGPARNAGLCWPAGLAFDSQGSLFIAADTRVRKIGGTPPPQINNIVPSAATTGTLVTITGANFGSSQGQSTITFNGETAYPTSWSDTAITVPVPLIRTISGTNGVVVTVGSTASNNMPFSIIPRIDALDPSWGAAGTEVTIIGSGFGTGYGERSITFNGVPAAPVIVDDRLVWAPTAIGVTVPAGATSGPVVVTVEGMASNGMNFTMAPMVTSLSPSSGSADTVVTISGANFGAKQESSTVTFNGAGAAITSWSDTRIVATVPSGATTGPVVVTVGGAPSNGTTFTVAPSVVITYPLDGASVNRPDTAVTGKILNSTGEVAVKVNDQLAMVNGQDFAINGVNLADGPNVITAALTDASGFSTTTSITVNRYTYDGYVKLSTSLEAGLAPMEPQLTLGTSLPAAISQTDLVVEGPSAGSFYTIQFPILLTIPSPGLHLATVTVRTTDGYTYEDKIALNVLDETATEGLLRAKWDAMWAALLGGNIDGAMTFFASSSQARYRSIFTDLQAQLPTVFSGIEGFHLLWVRGNAAEAEAIRTEAGEGYSYPVTLDRSETGFWKFKGF